MDSNTQLNIPVTGIPLIDDALKLLGAVLFAMTVLGALLPPGWEFTQWLVRFSADLRGILKAPEEATANPVDEKAEDLG